MRGSRRVTTAQRSSNHRSQARKKESAQQEACHSVCGQSVEHYSSYDPPSNYFDSNDILWHRFFAFICYFQKSQIPLFSGLLRCNPRSGGERSVNVCCLELEQLKQPTFDATTYGSRKEKFLLRPKIGLTGVWAQT